MRGEHTLALTRGGFTFAPGNGGAAVVSAIFLTRAQASEGTLRSVSAAHARRLCASRYDWVELFAGASAGAGIGG